MVDNPPLLTVSHLEKRYGDRTVVSDLSFSLHAGEVVGLLGPNGAGKTTAFYLTMGLIRPDNGSVFFKGIDVTHYPVDKRAKLGMGYLAQEPSVFRHLTVSENILCILETLPLSKQERQARLEELLHELHLEARAHNKASGLSGGERRRLEITRALVTNPSLLLLDEPFANIDPLTIHDVKKMIRWLATKNIAVLVTDHNAREIFSIVDKSYLMQDGKIFLSGTAEQLINNANARQIYLGSDFQL